MDYLIIQLAENRVNLARFEIGAGSASLTASAAFELDPEHGLESIVSRIAEEVAGSPRVVLCLPPELFAQRMVELPLTDLRKAREVLPSHLQGDMTLPGEEVVFDLLPSSEGNFIAIWAKKTEIAHAVSLFAAAGLEPAVISSAHFAWQALPGITSDCVVTDGTALVVISADRPAFIRAVNPEQFDKEPALILSALEMSGMLLPPSMFVFNRPAGELPSLPGFSMSAVPLKMPDDMSPVFKTGQAFSQTAGLYAVARACYGRTMPDFRRGELAWTAGDARLRKKLLLTAFLTAAVILLLFGYKGWQYQQASADLVSLNKSIFSIYKEIFPGRVKAADELVEVKGEIRKLGGGGNAVSVLSMLRRVAQAKGASINGLYEAELEGRTLRIKGDAVSAQRVNDFKDSLAPFTAAVELGEVKSRPDGGVSFQMTATIKEGQL